MLKLAVCAAAAIFMTTATAPFSPVEAAKKPAAKSDTKWQPGVNCRVSGTGGGSSGRSVLPKCPK